MDNLSDLRILNIAVFLGGWSAEREISLISGNSVLTSLKKLGLKASGIDLKSKEDCKKNFEEFDLVFNALHGKGGEDGFIQSILEEQNINFTGSKAVSSRISFNKIETKKLWREMGLPTPDFVEIKNIKTPLMELNHFVSGDENIISLEKSFVVKPAREGSSFGISIVKPHEGSLEDAMELASKFDHDVLIEAFVDGTEMTVAILGEKTMPPITIFPANLFYDYESKYLSKKTRYEASKLTSDKKLEIQDLALKAFTSLGCEGWGRVDFIQDKENNFQIIEINTVPGLTETSLFPKAAAIDGLEYDDLITEIIKIAFKDIN